MRSPRQNKIDVAITTVLELTGGFMLPDSILKADAARLVVPRASDSELINSIEYHDRAGRLTTVQAETERKRKLNDAGTAWHQENA